MRRIYECDPKSELDKDKIGEILYKIRTAENTDQLREAWVDVDGVSEIDEAAISRLRLLTCDDSLTIEQKSKIKEFLYAN